jgi:CheY-like chemotaxis protein
LKPEAVRVHEVLERLETLVHSTLPSDITFQISNTIPGTAYLLDKGMLQDALLNLIINARDAIGSEGSIKLTTSIVQETWLEFIVTDSGPGFSERALRHALDPFFTTKGEHGTGLGLPMVYDMVKLSGGRLKLGNNYVGARVSLRLPIRKGVPAQQNALTLLVEDNTNIRDSLRDELTSLGHSVVEASSASEAITLLSGLPEISLILSDLQLRGEETGLSILKERGNKAVLFMTSLPITDPLRIEAAKHAHVLSKPIDNSILRNILAKGSAL